MLQRVCADCTLVIEADRALSKEGSWPNLIRGQCVPTVPILEFGRLRFGLPFKGDTRTWRIIFGGWRSGSQVVIGRHLQCRWTAT